MINLLNSLFLRIVDFLDFHHFNKLPVSLECLFSFVQIFVILLFRACNASGVACLQCRVNDIVSSHACSPAFVGELSTRSNCFGRAVQSRSYPLSQPPSQPRMRTTKANSMTPILCSSYLHSGSRINQSACMLSMSNAASARTQAATWWHSK